MEREKVESSVSVASVQSVVSASVATAPHVAVPSIRGAELIRDLVLYPEQIDPFRTMAVRS